MRAGWVANEKSKDSMQAKGYTHTDPIAGLGTSVGHHSFSFRNHSSKCLVSYVIFTGKTLRDTVCQY